MARPPATIRPGRFDGGWLVVVGRAAGAQIAGNPLSEMLVRPGYVRERPGRSSGLELHGLIEMMAGVHDGVDVGRLNGSPAMQTLPSHTAALSDLPSWRVPRSRHEQARS